MVAPPMPPPTLPGLKLVVYSFLTSRSPPSGVLFFAAAFESLLSQEAFPGLFSLPLKCVRCSSLFTFFVIPATSFDYRRVADTAP